MRFSEESLSASHPNAYPDTLCVDPDYNLAPLDSAALRGTLGTTYCLPQDNFCESISSQPDDPLEFAWMISVNEHLANDFFPQPFVQHADQILFDLPSSPDAPWSLSSSSTLSQWYGDASHSNSSSMLGYYLDQSVDVPVSPCWPGPNAITAGHRLGDFRVETVATDGTSGTLWNHGMASHCLEQPNYVSVDDTPHLPAPTVFTEHNLDYCPFPRFATPPYDAYPSPPSTPQSLPHDRDRRPISLPANGSSVVSTINRWKCPHCNYVQGRRRMVDLKRHIATHTKPSDVALWTCCGFPREVARSRGVPEDVVRATSVIYGRVGGCWETFSRRDALQRHLRKQKGRCFGDAYAEWHPGNKNKRDRPQATTRAHVEGSCQWDAYE